MTSPKQTQRKERSGLAKKTSPSRNQTGGRSSEAGGAQGRKKAKTGGQTNKFQRRDENKTSGQASRFQRRDESKTGEQSSRYPRRSGLKSRNQGKRPWSPRPQLETWGQESERLQKVIAGAGLCSRRGAEDLIARGLVTINGVTVTELGRKVNPAKEKIRVEGYLLPPPQKLHYYMFHKPAGYLTTLADPQGRATIKPYLDELPVRVFPVGRLDMDVEGLLILTNDGALAKNLMHPSSQVPKIYRVKVAGIPDQDDLDRLRHGDLLVGNHPAAPAEAEMIKNAEDRAWLLLTLTEGRHHQVKRMCSAIGHPVLKLKRISYAGLDLGTLRREIIRSLNPAEVRHLKEMAQGPPPPAPE